MNRDNNTPEAIVIGCSAGGLKILRMILSELPLDIDVSVIIVSHIASDGDYHLPAVLNKTSPLPVEEAVERESILPRHVYIAPPNYHLLIEAEHVFSLSIDDRVCYVRPSIDVLFNSAADVYRSRLIGVILTGANHDGVAGLKAIKAAGGYCLVQDPNEAEAATMPKAAAPFADKILPAKQLAMELVRYCRSSIKYQP